MIHTFGIQPHRFVLNIVLNLILLPVYIILFALALLIAFSPLFPARVSRDNLKNRTGANPLSATLGTSFVLFHYAIVLIEDFVLWPLSAVMLRDNPTIRQELETASATAQEHKRGVAVLSAHFGNIEITADAVRLCLIHQVTPATPIIALAKPSSHPWATQLLFWYRRKRLIDVILTNRKDMVKAMLLALKQGRAVALLVDQKPASAGLFVPFFGLPAAFPEGGIEVALRAKCEFICIASRRLWPGIYTVEGKWLNHESTAEEPLNALVAGYAQWLEEIVHKSLWQWCWDYKKWSRQPIPANNNPTPLAPNS